VGHLLSARYGAPTRRHHERGVAAISASPTRGTLRLTTDSPATGERIEQFFTLGNVVFEQILSGADVKPEDYLQDQDEWVVVLAGRAVMEVAGDRVELAAGDWVLLPAAVPHRLVEVDAGTNWLAVHVH
jgi:cupin 2 domain-containing protein